MDRSILLGLDGVWTLSYMRDREYAGLAEKPRRGAELPPLEKLTVKVPGVFGQDLYLAGKTKDPYYSLNILDQQDYEDMHLFYYRRFPPVSGDRLFLRLEGTDTFADVFVNGCLIGRTDNMLIPFEMPVPDGLLTDENEIFIHIKPASAVSRLRPTPANSACLPYLSDMLYVRRAPSLCGWDIMPRIPSGGIWRSVSIVKKPENGIGDAFIYTASAVDGGDSVLYLRYTLDIPYDDLKDFTIAAGGVCGDSRFYAESRVYGICGSLRINVPDSKLWYPRNYGEPSLYDVRITLYKNGIPADVYETRAGIRTVRLDRTSTTDVGGNGEFCFVINGKKIFYLGTNWVPLDAFHSNDIKRLDQTFALLLDSGCNGVRCWGGNVYESDRFYELCDEHGLMVWQDFAMACGVYPQEPEFYEMIRAEVKATVKRLRNHPGVILWAGDNECDYSYMYGSGVTLDPNGNAITRRVIPEILRAEDFSRPYLPSSPYIDEEGFRSGGGDGYGALSEDHIWGPRDYYKGKYYKSTLCHFASEIGYHGCPSPSSLSRFISPENLYHWYDEKVLKDEGRYTANAEWRVHGTSPELDENAPFAYRTALMVSQIKTLFGAVPGDLRDFALASQISQAEAMKFFIERFRLSKWRRTGIIWWNLTDGWPQISDAVVDYYYHKKLAYFYIRRSQQPVCFMFDEPSEHDGKTAVRLCGVNDLQKDINCGYRVYRIGVLSPDAQFGEGKTMIAEGEITLKSNASETAAYVDFEDHAFYLIEWEYGGQTYRNTYLCGDPVVSLEKYVKALDITGMNDFSE
ncbi:MAG: hypothetical protein J6330_03215 [Clostridia bacterium]|nr:hypothetical protein [Clostridia bacterium]